MRSYLIIRKLSIQMLIVFSMEITSYCLEGMIHHSFVIKVLSEYNSSIDKEFYLLTTVNRDSRILSLTIKAKVNGKNTVKISIHDSYMLLSSSLDKLCESYNLEVSKGFSCIHTFKIIKPIALLIMSKIFLC